jgi:hypothetical protein
MISSWPVQKSPGLSGPSLSASAAAVAAVLHEAGYELEEVATRAHPDKVRHFERAAANQLWQTDLVTFILTAHPYNVFDFTANHKRDGPRLTRARLKPASSRSPATPTRAASSTRPAAATGCARTRRWPTTASSMNWSGLPRTSATRSVCKCARTWRCRSWASSTHG